MDKIERLIQALNEFTDNLADGDYTSKETGYLDIDAYNEAYNDLVTPFVYARD